MSSGWLTSPVSSLIVLVAVDREALTQASLMNIFWTASIG